MSSVILFLLETGTNVIASHLQFRLMRFYSSKSDL